MSTSDVKKEGFWTRTLNYGRTVLPNTMKSGVLGIISNNKVTLAHLVVAMTMVGLELFLNAEVFNCPLKNHVCYGLMFLTGPPCIIFVVNLLIVGRIWTLSNRCCVKEYRRKGECFFYVFPNVVKALVGGLVWLMVAFIDTRYFVCAVVGQDINKRNLTDSEEIKSLQHQIDHAKGLSHVFAWVVFLVMVVFGATVVIVKRCYRKAHVLAADGFILAQREAIVALMTFNEITNGLRDELKKSGVESGDKTDTNENKTPDAVVLENGIQWLPGNPKIRIYPEGIPETRGRQHVKEMFECHENENDWDYQDALKKFREMYPRAATGDPRDPWRKKDVKPCSSTKCDIKATSNK
ncbi:uncharacterized protein LOC110045981 isoform X2 [Orbicella faveolata]|uniref:uncharacterized protein LOC110045980 isoform X2 n=1 Tax=Orbicella faveolata TaxID=48498 RepID=UPI0009E653E3|nr:uncharacterized protein LOC110045980 isoform X2 [Orbicella faveolata]XP_020607304.1 uncharacterized protein LOC110045981 isoform X2 [Orbicella faveolata]